jgi:SNF2 family DNA or RNA helicase
VSDLLEDITQSEKVIVWTNFIETYRLLGEVCEKLGLKHVFLTGQQTKKQKDDAIEQFETDPDTRVIIGNPRAGGIGVDLISASSAIYYTRSFSKEDDDQSEGRNYRGGSEKHLKITRYDIVCPGTTDEIVLDALENKANVAESILSWARGL